MKIINKEKQFKLYIHVPSMIKHNNDELIDYHDVTYPDVCDTNALMDNCIDNFYKEKIDDLHFRIYAIINNEFYYLDNSGSMDIICFKKNKGGIYLYNADHCIIHQQTRDGIEFCLQVVQNPNTLLYHPSDSSKHANEPFYPLIDENDDELMNHV